MSWKQLSCPVLLCLWLVTFISLIKFGALSLAVCFCQSAYVWTASENPSFHIFLTSELRVGGRGCVSQESNIHTHSSQWLARCVEVRRWEGTAAVNWLFTLLLSAAAQPSLLEITFILRSFVVMTLDVTCSNPAGGLSCHLSPLSLSDNGIKWPKNNSIIIFKKRNYNYIILNCLFPIMLQWEI